MFTRFKYFENHYYLSASVEIIHTNIINGPAGVSFKNH